MSEQERKRVLRAVLGHLRKSPDATWTAIADSIGYRNGHSLQNYLSRVGLSLGVLRCRAGVARGPLGKPRKSQTIAQEPAEQQLAHLRAENARLLSVSKDAEKRLGARAELDRSLLAAVRGFPSPKPMRDLGDRKRRAVSVVLALGDWHVGEVIDPAETEGVNAYNFEIARNRLGYLVGKFLAWVDMQRRAYRIDECVVPVLGDLVSGEMHDELMRTNEFEPTRAAANAGYELGRLILTLAERFKSVRVEAISADNHGRLDRKKPAKHKGERNWNFVAYELAAATLRDCRNVEFNRPAGQKYLTTIAGHRFLLEHGDNVQGWMGIPLYGMLRMRGREADRRSKDGGLDYILVGHWHNPWYLQGIYGVGCLSGTSELDEGQARHSAPSQTAFLVHPRWGVYNVVNWDLSAA